MAPIRSTDTEKMLASIIIPTFNAGNSFFGILQVVTTQILNGPFEILIIDSGSTDDTFEIISRFPDVRLIQIKKEEFNHGRTRNLGVELTSGKYIAFLTQDAQPVENTWLASLIGMFDLAPDIAGVFGKHLAYPNADPFIKRDLSYFFDYFIGQNPHVVRKQKETDLRLDGIELQQLYHFFSDNNSCVKRSIIEKIPFPEVDFGEDQVWAKTIIEAGYAKAYAPSAIVYHSHNYKYEEMKERSETESYYFYKLFGYKLFPGLPTMIRNILFEIYRDYKFSRYYLEPTLIYKRIPIIIAKHLGHRSGYLRASNQS